MNCPNCDIQIDYHDCITEPGATPSNGDVGVCFTCREWWTMDDGELITYSPSTEEVGLANQEMDASFQRSERVRKSIQ